MVSEDKDDFKEELKNKKEKRVELKKKLEEDKVGRRIE